MTEQKRKKKFEVVVGTWLRAVTKVTVQDADDERDAFAKAKDYAAKNPGAVEWQTEPIDPKKIEVYGFKPLD